jgi:hypothetical protein
MRAAVGVLAVLMAGGTSLAAPPKQLAWAYEAIAGSSAAPPAGANAIVLLDEVTVRASAGADEVSRLRRRKVVRILGSEAATDWEALYYSKDRRLVSFHAWTIRPDGTLREFDRTWVVDVAVSPYAEFNDSRSVVLRLKDVGVGSVVVVEYEVDRHDAFLQEVWAFQGRFPVALSRFVLDVPDTWKVDHRIIDGPPVEPVRDARGLIWEMRDLPGLEGNRSSAPREDSATKLALSYAPRADAPTGRAFASWEDVARWYYGLVTSQSVADEAIRTTVAGGKGDPDPLARLRALGRSVQDVRYVAIELGESAYRPHASAQVFKNRYGDCKDKATLLLTMLREAGIESFPVMVDTRVDGRVLRELASPSQFNHVILAIPVAPTTDLPATIEHPTLGRLLLFDPTDDLTPLGDLPWTDQGTLGLLVHPAKGGLIELPILPPAASKAERAWTLKYSSSAPTEVTLKSRYSGQYARDLRSFYSGIPDVDRGTRFVASLGRVPGARLDEATFTDLATPERDLGLDVRFVAARFGRQSGALLMIQPLAVVDSFAPVLPSDPRGLPALIPFQLVEVDTVDFLIPSGWKAGELPPERTLSTPFGSFTLRIKPTETGLLVERRLQLEAREIPLADYVAARSFLDDVAKATAVTLVLERS